MKHNIIALTAAILLASCGTYTGQGAYTGASFGSILGSAIGGISNGPRGSDIGTIVGMAGGAIIGGVIGQQADQQRQADLAQYRNDKAERAARHNNGNRQNHKSYNAYGNDVYENSNGYNDSNNNSYNDSNVNYNEGYNGYNNDSDNVIDPTNSGDDRLYDFSSSDYTGTYSAQQPFTQMPASSSVDDLLQGMKYAPHIEIRNARIVDANQDNIISRGELCKVIFEVYNTGQSTLHDIQPTVVEATGNRHLFISPGMHVEQLQPGAGIRYTAMLKADNRLGDGTAHICLSVVQGENAISKVTEFTVPTCKKKIK